MSKVDTESLANLPHNYIENLVVGADRLSKAETPETAPPVVEYDAVKVRELISETPRRPNASIFRNIDSRASFTPADAILSTTRVGNVLYSDSQSAAKSAEALFQYTLQNEPDLSGFLELIKNSQAFGETRALQCVFHSDPMDEILDQKDRYQKVDGVFTALYNRQGDLMKCLPVAKRIWYLPQILGIIKSFQAKRAMLNGLSGVYADLRDVSPGVAATDLISYFFRQDKLDARALQIFDLYVQKIENHLGPKPKSKWFGLF